MSRRNSDEGGDSRKVVKPAPASSYHQEAVPVEKFKFDPEADAGARGDYLTPKGQEQDMRTKERIQKARIAAQIASHKNPKNKAY